MFTDIHAHIIPGVDDGPKILSEAIALARLAVAEGCDKIIATPHFYGSKHGLDERLGLVSDNFSQLTKAINEEAIPISLIMGFEVRYFSGISRSESLHKLCLGSSNYLLLELGSGAITDEIIGEIAELHYRGFDVILAHIERYYKFPGFKKIKSFLAKGGALAQVTATSLLEPPYIKPTLGLLRSGIVNFVAGDMHSVDVRPPRMKEAFKVVAAKFGDEALDKLIINSEELFYRAQNQIGS